MYLERCKMIMCTCDVNVHYCTTEDNISADETIRYVWTDVETVNVFEYIKNRKCHISIKCLDLMETVVS